MVVSPQEYNIPSLTALLQEIEDILLVAFVETAPRGVEWIMAHHKQDLVACGADIRRARGRGSGLPGGGKYTGAYHKFRI